MTIEALPVAADEDRSVGAFADDQIDGAGGSGCERDGDVLAAFAVHKQCAVTA